MLVAVLAGAVVVLVVEVVPGLVVDVEDVFVLVDRVVDTWYNQWMPEISSGTK